MASHFNPAQPNITIYRDFKGSGAYVWSPFVTKLEARLRFSGLSYRTELGSPMKSPRGKLPYVAITPKPDFGIQAASVPPTVLSDSTLIVDTLIKDGVVDDLNATLPPVEKAHDLALRALLEEKLYFYQGYERWHENYYTIRPHILAALPYPIQLVVGLLVYRKVSSALYGQGTGRLSAEEISVFRQQIWESIESLLSVSRRRTQKTETGKGIFWVLGGDGPSEMDATVFGFIASSLVCDAAPESRKLVKSLPAVMEYARRIHEAYFPDYERWE